jgi:phosphoribosylformylglycinamidine cyclo-ligase
MYNPIKPYKHQILKSIERTWQTPYVKVQRGVYPLIEKKFKYPEVDHTDGIGTKGFYHWRSGTLRAAVIDALAMNLNDLALVRAVPFKMSNHITVPEEDKRVFTIVQAMVAECTKRKIAMVGGENSFHNNIDGVDISMTVSGFVKKPQANLCRVGDVLIGLKSSGIHSNGFTKVRKIFGNTVRKEFTIPTAIYLDDVLKVIEKHTVHGMMHITGGAFTKLKDVIEHADIELDHTKVLQPQKIFYEMFNKGLQTK